MFDIDLSDFDFERLKEGEVVTFSTDQDIRALGNPIMLGTDEDNCLKINVIDMIYLTWSGKYVVQIQRLQNPGSPDDIKGAVGT